MSRIISIKIIINLCITSFIIKKHIIDIMSNIFINSINSKIQLLLILLKIYFLFDETLLPTFKQYTDTNKISASCNVGASIPTISKKGSIT